MNTPPSSEHIQRFKQDGYLVFDFALDDSLLEAIKRGVYPLYDEKFRNGEVPTTRVQDVWREVEAARVLARQPNIMAALEQLFGSAALPFQTLNFPVGTQQLPHSDTIHFNSKPRGYMAGAGWHWKISTPTMAR